MQSDKKPVIIAIALLLLMGVAGCSTKKNTAGTRFYHAMTTRYNVYFNGNEAYKAGCKAIEQGNKDNYMEMLPLYPIGNKSTVGTGGGDFERAIEKSQKAIAVHSIKRKPQRKPGRRYTDEYKKWLARREFNPFLHRAWMLMGKAQFQKGDFPEAAATFSYIIRIYAGQPKITADARIWLARCYTQLGWFYDAEDALQKVNNDSLPYTLAPAYSTAYGHYLLGSKRYKDAIPHLLTTIKHEKNKKQKAREYYLLGQVYQLIGEGNQAYDAYGKVIKLSPPYELELNARIRQTACRIPLAGAVKMVDKKAVDKLRKMSRSDKNKDYLDQIYYGIGNIYLAGGDTLQAIKEYKTGVEKSTRGGVEKGILQLTLGDLCWKMGRFAEAQTAYADAIGLLEKTHPQYAEVTRRSEVLDELVPFTTAVELQDSLQHLASLDSAARMIVIDTLIARVIQKEEAEKKAAREAERQQMREEIEAENAAQNPQKPSTPQPTIPTGDNSWYFYNPQIVSQGKADFQRKWGKRKLEDNWRRRNKTVVALDDFEPTNYDEPDSEGDTASGEGDTTGDGKAKNIGEGGAANDSIATAEADTAAIDAKNPQFYLEQIPLTEEKMAASNEILSDGLFHMGMIFKDKLEDYPRAEHSFKRLIYHFPEFNQLDEAYYNLYLMLGQQERTTDADSCKTALITAFPESKYALILSDPDFAYNAVYGKHLEDSLYADTYKKYQEGNIKQVAANAEISARKYPMGHHRPKFMFLHAVAALLEGDQKQFLTELKELVQQYPENEITDLAAHILKGVQEGRLLEKGSISFGSIWGRRSAAEGFGENDSLRMDSIPTFSTERNTPYLFILAYEEGKVNENQLLYEVARYNFSSFMVKNFDLDFAHDRGIGRLIIRSFANYEEAKYYQQRLYADPHMNERLSGMRAILISESNYELLNQYYSFDDYDAFYQELVPIEHPLPDESTLPEDEVPTDGSTLDEPLQNLPPVDETQPEEEDDGEEVEEDGGSYYVY
ncbi:tetratricopeptide repeat protein [Jilunia laotingensis]|jgi:tetratricopeptide (TPR) repeat protein|nr:tetratricopeptide repeat protein [Jilunia laotingensis]